MKKIILFLCILWSVSLWAQTFPVETIKKSGADNNRINLVFLSDGYTSAEMGIFLKDVDTILMEMFKKSPFKEYKDFFNVYAIKVPSQESGATHPQTSSDFECKLQPKKGPVKNYFGSTFDFGGIHRLLVATNYTALDAVMAKNFPAFDQAFVVVNSPYYGGSGGQFATASSDISSALVAIHEIGHSFVGLGDEYGGSGGPAKETPNTTQKNTRTTAPWKIWIDAKTPVPTPDSMQDSSTIGIYEGAAYYNKGWYRPAYNCIMRFGTDYCPVCREQYVMKFYDMVKPIESYSPVSLDLKPAAADTLIQFSIHTVHPNPNTFKREWFMNYFKMGENSDTLNLNLNNVFGQYHDIWVNVLDTTEFIKNPAHKTTHLFSVKWKVTEAIWSGMEKVEENHISFSVSPNPTQDVISINLDTEKEVAVKMEVYNLMGQKVASLFDETLKSGQHSLRYDLRKYRLNSGIYFVRLTVNGSEQSYKVVLQ